MARNDKFGRVDYWEAAMFQKILGAVIGLVIPCVALSAAAQDTYLGAREFKVSCAVCHGTTGKGDGEMAKLLTIKPADLTVLARNNGGEFPFLSVFWVIDGRTLVSGHGDRIMPIWGERYEAQTGVGPGTFGAEVLVNSRINDLVYFIGSIQEQ